MRGRPIFPVLPIKNGTKQVFVFNLANLKKATLEKPIRTYVDTEHKENFPILFREISELLKEKKTKHGAAIFIIKRVINSNGKSYPNMIQKYPMLTRKNIGVKISRI